MLLDAIDSFGDIRAHGAVDGGLPKHSGTHVKNRRLPWRNSNQWLV
jgi:hypothetical protein